MTRRSRDQDPPSRVGSVAVLAGLALGAAVLGGAAIAVAHANSTAAGTQREISVQQMRFTPPELTVRLGDTVTFRNADIVRHNAVRRDVFDTGELGTGRSASWVPADTGTFGYQCTIHPRMRGLVVVESPTR